MREVESVGVKALGMRHQQGVSYPKKAKSVQSGSNSHYHHHHNNNNNNGHYHHLSAKVRMPDNSGKQPVHHNSQVVLSQSAPQVGQEFGVKQQGNSNKGKGKFHRTSSLNDAPSAVHYYRQQDQRNNCQKSSRFRTTSGDVTASSAGCTSGSDNTSSRSSPTSSLPRSPISFTSPKPALNKIPGSGYVTPVKRSVDADTYFAMSKFTDSPKPSALPPPPAHWITPKKTQDEKPVFPGLISPCKTEFHTSPLTNNRFDGIDVTAHFKTLLRVEM